ncbi:hypothetical protein TNIN_422711 [Trichonephila inaurata madagascariensis]|uniref:Uncharacterized protein n=1 Tax=Trichonephila inaurata madagascariensis TaxID=2747483 RepID=A0A8X6WRS6_9ARAC|nr:hypothetical protein TNIN_422711 [Trichonephila inaurata madagascariensis]
MRGLKDGLLPGKPLTFPDVRGRLKHYFGGKERRKTASDHLTQPETGATLIYPPQALGHRTLSDRVTTLSLFRKGLVCLNVPPILDPVEALGSGLKHQSAS